MLKSCPAWFFITSEHGELDIILNRGDNFNLTSTEIYTFTFGLLSCTGKGYLSLSNASNVSPLPSHELGHRFNGL